MANIKSKSHWGIGITILYGSFVVFILAIIIFAVNQNFFLVEKDYYKKELEYQARIDRMKNTNTLSERLIIEHNQKDKTLTILFPKSLTGNEIEGEIQFFRPSDAEKDFILPVKVDSIGQQIVPMTKLAKGLWKVKIRWESNKVKYYNENSFVIE